MEALTQPEIVRQIVLAAFGNEHPGSFAMKRAQRKAEELLAEIREAEVEAMAKHYGAETLSDIECDHGRDPDEDYDYEEEG